MTLLAAMVAGAFAVTSSTPGASGAHDAHDDDLIFECSTDGISLVHLIDVASEATGEPFFYEPRDVRDEKVFLSEQVVVPRTRYLPVFDLFVHRAGFIHVERRVAGTRVHSIRKLGSSTRSSQSLKTEARIVPPEEAGELTDRLALVTTWVICRSGSSARQIACPTLCQFFVDSSTESIRSIEGTDVILMTGLSANVSKYAAMAERIDALLPPDADAIRANEIEKRIRVLEERVAALSKAAPKMKKR